MTEADDDQEIEENDGDHLPDEPCWTPLVESFAYYFDRPVALQLTHPVVQIDNFGPTVNVPISDSEHEVFGTPQIPADHQGNVAASPILVGVLSPSECGTRILLKMRGATGALIETSIDPQDVKHATLILEPGQANRPQNEPEPSRIISPYTSGKN